MMSAMTGCGDWLNSTPAESKVELFGLSLWSQRKTDPKSEKTHCPLTFVSENSGVQLGHVLFLHKRLVDLPSDLNVAYCSRHTAVISSTEKY